MEHNCNGVECPTCKTRVEAERAVWMYKAGRGTERAAIQALELHFENVLGEDHK